MPLIERLWPAPATVAPASVRVAVLVAAATVLMALCAALMLPAERPFTLQSLAVLGVALAFGPWLALASVGAYLAAGLLGLPVYPGAATWGASFVLSPVFGTYVGYLLAAVLVGWLATRDTRPGWTGLMGAAFLGQMLVHAVNIPWMAAYMTKGSGFPFAAMLDVAYSVETRPFLLADLIKLILAASIVWGAGRILRARPAEQ